MEHKDLENKINILRKKIFQKEVQIQEAITHDPSYGFYSNVDKNKISVFGIYEKKPLTFEKEQWKKLIKFITNDDFLHLLD